MKKLFGTILLVSGLTALLITGIHAIQQTKTFSFLGLDIVVSNGSYTPVIISLVVMIMGIVLLASAKGK